MGMRIVSRPASVVKQPRPFGAGREWRATNFAWRDVHGNDHVAVFTTGTPAPNTPEGVRHFDSALRKARRYAAYCAKFGDGFGEFRVSKGGEYFGRGYFPAGTIADDVPFMFARLLKQGFRGHIVPGIRDVDQALGVVAHFAADERSVPPAPYGFDISIAHPDDGTREYVSIAKGETPPQWIAGVYWAKLADYRSVLKTFEPRAFLIYNAARKSARPTAILELQPDANGKRVYRNIGELQDGEDGGGYIAEAHGRFDSTPTADDLARIAARLAASGRWMALVKEERDDVSPDIMLLMSALTPEEFVCDDEDDFG